MKNRLALGALGLVLLVLGGCAAGGPSRAGSSPAGSARCLGRPDTSGTQPLIYLLCIQSS